MDNVDQNCLKMHLYVLRLHLLWPSDTARPRRFRDFFFVSCFYWAVPLFAFLATIRIYFIPNVNSEDLTEYVLIVIVSMIFMYLLLTFFWKTNEIVLFVEDLRSFGQFGRPKGLRKLTQEQNNNVKILYIFSLFGILMNSFYAYYLYNQCEMKNTENGTSTPCTLLMSIWVPRVFISIYYVKLLVFTVQTILMWYCFLPVIISSYLLASIIELITIRVVHLRCLLHEVSAIPTEEMEKKLVRCIKYHVDILRLKKWADSCFNLINAVQFPVMPILLGFIFYRIMMNFNVPDILQFVSGLIITVIFSHKGQQLINQSNLLAEDVYSMQWLKLENRFKHYIKLMMLKTQIPMAMKAGILYNFSYEHLLAIARTSYTLLTLLNNLKAMDKI